MGHLFYTVGHSTRSLPEFLALLRAYGIAAIADIRAFPSSRCFPHFSQESLAVSLEQAGLEYVWLGKELGGYRKTGLGAASPNTAWASPGFQNYADHMLSEEFHRGTTALLALGQRNRTAILCAERCWWRCHRRLLSDWLVAQGHGVIHILELNRAVEHRLPPFAKVEAGGVTYPREALWSHGCGKASFRKSSRVGKRGV